MLNKLQEDIEKEHQLQVQIEANMEKEKKLKEINQSKKDIIHQLQ